MSNLCVLHIFPVLPQHILVYPEVSHLHISVLFGLIPFKEHIAFFVFFLFVCTDCVHINWVFRLKLVSHFFGRLIFVRLLGLLAYPHIQARLLRSSLFCFLPLRLSFLSNSLLPRHRLLLFLRLLLRLLLSWGLIFRWSWIENPCRFGLFLLVCKSWNVNGFAFEL